MNVHNIFSKLLPLMVLAGCVGYQSKSRKPELELRNIELLRGDIILCSGSSFGEVDFGLSCKIPSEKHLIWLYHYCTHLNLKRQNQTFVKLLYYAIHSFILADMRKKIHIVLDNLVIALSLRENQFLK